MDKAEIVRALQREHDIQSQKLGEVVCQLSYQLNRQNVSVKDVSTLVDKAKGYRQTLKLIEEYIRCA